MKDSDKVELLAGDQILHEWVGTWKEFVSANVDGRNGGSMDTEESQEVAAALDRGEVYTFGGGAESVVTLRKMRGN